MATCTWEDCYEEMLDVVDNLLESKGVEYVKECIQQMYQKGLQGPNAEEWEAAWLQLILDDDDLFE